MRRDLRSDDRDAGLSKFNTWQNHGMAFTRYGRKIFVMVVFVVVPMIF